MTCPYLEYRTSGDDVEFDHERAYCTVVNSFVAPMRADICNEVAQLHPEKDCEFYREHENID